jgi:hypothetical protein
MTATSRRREMRAITRIGQERYRLDKAAQRRCAAMRTEPSPSTVTRTDRAEIRAMRRLAVVGHVASIDAL